VDGLGRPVPGVKITVQSHRKREAKTLETVLRTGNDGGFAGTLAPGDDGLEFEKEGYNGFSTLGEPGDQMELTMTRQVDWSAATTLPLLEGDELDRGLREFLSSEDLGDEHGEVLSFLFRHQDGFRPAFRRLISDLRVGASIRDWLDLMDDPRDHDLFPKGRKYAPKKEVKEADLIDALKATARQRNFFSSAPEPRVDIDFIVFTKGLDCVLIQCGINRVAMTGITWQFVIRKAGKQWELRSVKEEARS
jgi:hypothetical protein